MTALVDAPPAGAATPTVRPVLEADEARLRAIFAATRGAPMLDAGLPETTVAALMDQQYEAQRVGYTAARPTATWQAIVVDGDVVGRIVTDPCAGEESGSKRVHLVDVFVDPTRQHEGIGTAVLLAVLADADEAGCDVTLEVDRDAPAEHWYRRHGFVATGGDQLRLHLVHRATTAPHERRQRDQRDHHLAGDLR